MAVNTHRAKPTSGKWPKASPNSTKSNWLRRLRVEAAMRAAGADASAVDLTPLREALAAATNRITDTSGADADAGGSNGIEVRHVSSEAGEV